MRGSQNVDQVTLDLVGVLIFVDEDELKLLLVASSNVLFGLKAFKPPAKQVIKIHHVVFCLTPPVRLLHACHFFCKMTEVGKLVFQDVFDAALPVGGQGEDIGQNLGFGKSGRFDVDPGRLDAALEQLRRIFSIHDGEIGLKSDTIAMSPQHTGTDGMKGASPRYEGLRTQKISYSLHHLPSCFVGEGEQKDAFWRNALL